MCEIWCLGIRWLGEHLMVGESCREAGIIAYRIAAHAADLARDLKGEGKTGDIGEGKTYQDYLEVFWRLRFLDFTCPSFKTYAAQGIQARKRSRHFSSNCQARNVDWALGSVGSSYPPIRVSRMADDEARSVGSDVVDVWVI